MDEIFNSLLPQLAGYKNDILLVVGILLSLALVQMAYRGLQSLIDREYNDSDDPDGYYEGYVEEEDELYQEWKRKNHDN